MGRAPWYSVLGNYARVNIFTGSERERVDAVIDSLERVAEAAQVLVDAEDAHDLQTVRTAGEHLRAMLSRAEYSREEF